MTAKNAIATDIKLNIAIAALSDAALKNKDLAEKFSVSETTVKRAKKDFAADAQKHIDALLAQKEADDKAKAAALVAAKPAAKAAKAPATTVAADDLDNYRGYRPRNGRMAIIRSVIGELGVDAKASDLYDRVSALSTEHNLKPIKKTAVYVLMSEEIRKLTKK